jgi:hypothetical protein
MGILVMKVQLEENDLSSQGLNAVNRGLDSRHLQSLLLWEQRTGSDHPKAFTFFFFFFAPSAGSGFFPCW